MILNEELINKIREEAEIDKIISDYVVLEKKGADFKGLCPFHQDSNPSLSVSPSKKVYKCFSCGAAGNVYTFLQNHLNISFPKAVQMVGEKIGINVELNEKSKFQQSFEKYYTILKSSSNFYNFCLKNTNDGKNALDYLYKRNLSDEIINRFQIGLSLNESDLLYKTLLNEKFQPLDMIESGVIRSANNNYYDIFKNRIMFPLSDLNGNVVGFSGRIYQDSKNNEAKYVNSGESVIFKKSNILYNYHDAISDIRKLDQVIIFEGFLDVIAAYRSDIHNAVATMGTALTSEHVKALAKLSKNVILCYDADNAGIEATKKAIQLFGNDDFVVKAVMIPEGLDPDDFVNKYGVEEFRKLFKKPLNAIEYLYESEIRQLNSTDIFSVEKFKNEIFKILSLYKSEVVNEIIISKMTKNLNVSKESLIADFKKFNKSVDLLPSFGDYPLEQEKPKEETYQEFKKYVTIEKELIRRIFNKKFAVEEVEKKLDTKYVLHRNILFSLYQYYHLHEIYNHQVFIDNLEKDDKTTFNEIINSFETYDEFEIKDLIENIDDKFSANKLLKMFREKKKEELSNLDLYYFRQLKLKTITKRK